jgi:hypothetical protein
MATGSIRKGWRFGWLGLIVLIASACHPDYFEVWVDNQRPTEVLVRIESGDVAHYYQVSPSGRGLAESFKSPHPDRWTILTADCVEVASGSIEHDATGIVIAGDGTVSAIPDQGFDPLGESLLEFEALIDPCPAP